MRDVTCRRTPEGAVKCSIPHRHVHHSPTGFELGYGGSGPADLALNVLAAAVGPPPDPGPEPAEDGYIPHLRTPTNYRLFELTDLEAFMAKMRVEPAGKLAV